MAKHSPESAPGNCTWSDWLSDFQENVEYECPDNYYIAGVGTTWSFDKGKDRK